MKLFRSLAALLLATLLATPALAEDTMDGVITSVDRGANTITVRNTATGDIRTYFVRPDTRISSQGQNLPMAQVKRGQQVSLRFNRTDAGRELLSFRVPEPLVIVDLQPFTVESERLVAGEITGLRKASQTVVVRDRDSGERRAVQMVADTRISRNGLPISFRQLAIGDEVALRYRVTEQGLLVVTARAPAATPVVASAEPLPAMLPKTAGNTFAWLLVAAGLIVGGLSLRLMRRRAA